MNDGGVSTATVTVPPSRSAWRETLHRVGLYTLRRVAVLLGTVVIGTYLAVLIANWGGEVDKMREAQCKERAGMSLQADPALQFLPRRSAGAAMSKRSNVASSSRDLIGHSWRAVWNT